MAWSRHEHVTDYTTAALLWFESGCKGDFERFARAYKVEVPSALTAERLAKGKPPGPPAAFRHAAETEA